MNLLLLISGILITGVVTYDIVHAIFAPDRASNITSRISSGIWKVYLWLSRVTGSRSALRGAGIVIIISIVAFWVLSVWTGCALIFLSSEGSILKTDTEENANTLEHIYYTGYVLSTLGNGDFKAGNNGWEIFTSFLSFFGLILITIVITYIVPVVSAVTESRSLSIYLATLGQSPQDILLNFWDGESFQKLDIKLEGLVKDIAHQGQLHLSYPVLHYFHNKNKTSSLFIQILVLDEAVTLLMYYVPEQYRPSRQSLSQIRMALTSYFDSLTITLFLENESNIPPLPDTSKLKQAGILVQEPRADEIKMMQERRSLLKNCINNTGWTWDALELPNKHTNVTI